MVINRKIWQSKSKEYLRSAKVLLDCEQYSIAYYTAGLAVECALKSVITRKFKNDTWPDKKFVVDIHTHDIARLVKLADLEIERLAMEARSANFRAYWGTLSGWRIDSRYQTWTKAEARDIIEAASRRSDGILSWLKKHW